MSSSVSGPATSRYNQIKNTIRPAPVKYKINTIQQDKNHIKIQSSQARYNQKIESTVNILIGKIGKKNNLHEETASILYTYKALTHTRVTPMQGKNFLIFKLFSNGSSRGTAHNRSLTFLQRVFI